VDFLASAVEVYIEILHAAAQHPLDLDVDDVRRRARRSVSMLGRLSRTFRNVRARAFLLRGLLRWHEGKRSSALAAMRRAESIAVGMNMPFERARALLETGRRSTGTRRIDELTAALQTFTALGADHYAGIARRLAMEQG
jgi:hypothetical protein